jgi:hypothetical protein
MFRYAEPAYFWPIIFVAAAAMPLLERWIAPLAIGQVAAVSSSSSPSAAGLASFPC